jgi:hypothetical protein
MRWTNNTRRWVLEYLAKPDIDQKQVLSAFDLSPRELSSWRTLEGELRPLPPGVEEQLLKRIETAKNRDALRIITRELP